MIGYGKQSIDESDIKAVSDVLHGDFLTCGPTIEAFESALCELSGAAHAVAVSNGTSALRLLYQVAGICAEKKVGVPVMTFVATASQAMLLGAEIVLLDVDPKTLLLTPEILEACETDLDYVIPVHMAGRLCDMQGIQKIAQARNICVLEDAAHACASTYAGGQRCGDSAWSEGAIWSFHPVKNICCGEGGVILTENQQWATALRSLRHHGIQPSAHSQEPWQHGFHHPATNERMSDIHAALGLSQLQRIANFKTARQKVVVKYISACADLPFIDIYNETQDDIFWHLCIAHIDWKKLGHDRQWLFQHFREQGVALQVHYIPLHQHALLLNAERGSSLKGAIAAYESIVSLPCYPTLSEADQDRVIDVLRQLA